MDIQELIVTLSRENYCLMTNEEGVELHDEKGNLLVFSAEAGKTMSVPNTSDVRKLYNLSQNEIGSNLNVKKSGKNNTPENDEQLVWIGRRTRRKSYEATKALILLFGSPKYQEMMNDRTTVKMRIWEKIAADLQGQGFKIANTLKKATLRTFQKWRNMERTYWTFIKNPDEFGEGKRRKKPCFIDDMHNVLSKRKKDLQKITSHFPVDEDTINSTTNMNEEIEIENSFENVTASFDTFRRPRCVKLPSQVMSELLSLANSSTYKSQISNQSVQKIKVWENIYDYISLATGLDFAKTRREGAIKLCQKWKNLEQKLRRLNRRPYKSYLPLLRKSTLAEITKCRSVSDLESPSSTEMSSSQPGQLKGEELVRIAPETVAVLLKLMDMDRYQELFGGNCMRIKIWEKLHDELEELGFSVPGNSKEEKCLRLYQKWQNLKNSCMKYNLRKNEEENTKKPLYYDLMLKLIYKDMFPNECTEEDLIVTDFLEQTHQDHDYFGTEIIDHKSVGKMANTLLKSPIKINDTSDITTGIVSTMCTTEPVTVPTIISVNESIITIPPDDNTVSSVITSSSITGPTFTEIQPILSPKLSSATQSSTGSSEGLLQIQALHESTLAIQQQNFTKIISLLEEQNKLQSTMNTLFTQYVTNQAKKSKSSSKNSNKTNESRNIMKEVIPLDFGMEISNFNENERYVQLNTALP